MKLDSATGYESAVGNKLMRSTGALKTNGMYSTTGAGDVVGDKAIGPTAIINYHKTRQESIVDFIEKAYRSQLNVINDVAIPMFYTENVSV